MVCKKCESKTSKLAAPDPFASSSSAIKSGSRKVGDNKLLRKAGGGKSNVRVRIMLCLSCVANDVLLIIAIRSEVL